MSRVIRALWPVAAWMAVVFVASTDLGSETHSSLMLEPILRWLNPNITPETFEHVQFFVRKAGHISEYAILALLTLRGLRILRDQGRLDWSWLLAAWTLGASAAYGATDEFHQLFVPSRGPSVRDVLIDAGGAAIGLLLAFIWMRLRRKPIPRAV